MKINYKQCIIKFFTKKGDVMFNKLKIQNNQQYYKNLKEDFQKKTSRPPKPHPDHQLIDKMRMKNQIIYDDMKSSIGEVRSETGGILIGDPNTMIIECFVFDLLAETNQTVYQPNTKFLNSVLKGRGHQFLGIAHSHTKGNKVLSQQDKNAAWSNLTSPNNSHLNAYLMPLIQTIPDNGCFEIIPYIVVCHPKGNGRVIVHKVELEILNK